MRVFNLSGESATYVSSKIPKSDNLILTITKIITSAAVGITAIIVTGIWGVVAIGVVVIIKICAEI